MEEKALMRRTKAELVQTALQESKANREAQREKLALQQQNNLLRSALHHTRVEAAEWKRVAQTLQKGVNEEIEHAQRVYDSYNSDVVLIN